MLKGTLINNERNLKGIKLEGALKHKLKLTFQATNGGEPFVLLFDPIIFGTPAGKKEIEVYVESLVF